MRFFPIIGFLPWLAVFAPTALSGDEPKRAEDLHESQVRSGGADDSESYRIPGLEKKLQHFRQIAALDDAAETLEALIAIDERQFGPSYWRVSTRQQELLTLRRAAGASKADQLLVVEVAKTRGLLHGRSAQSDFYDSEQNVLEAEMQLRRLLYTCRCILGDSDALTAAVLFDLARLKLGSSDYASAERLLYEALAIAKAQHPQEYHPLFAAIYDSLALTYEGGSRSEEAEKCFKVAITNYEHTIGADSLDCTAEVQRLGDLYNKVSQFKKAEALLERAVKVCRKHVPPEHLLYLISLLEQARAYIGLHDFAKANAVLDELLPIAERVAPTGSERMVDALDLRAVALHAVGRADEAQAVQRRADAMRTRYPSRRKRTSTERAP